MIKPCTHAAPSDAAHACPHLFDREDFGYHRRFTGTGARYDYVCDACARDPAPAPAPVCAACASALESEGYWSGIVGQPEVLARPSALRFARRTVRPAGAPTARLLDIAPVDALDRSVWIALTADGEFVRFDLDAARCDRLGALPPSQVDLAATPVRLRVDGRARLAAVVNDKGRHGVVVELESGRATMALDRGDYHEEHCRFSVAFVDTSSGPLLVHATAWNRLEVSDPRTGALRTARDAMIYRRDTPRPVHYLDYFHCGLTVSLDQRSIADNGWVWHPVGVVRTWSLERWLSDNPYESEDGASVRALCARVYYWDGPLCWVDDRTIAVAGYGDDDEWMLPAAVRLFDASSGAELRWFAGPRGELFSDGARLFACSPEEGTTVWDPARGERLHHAPGLCPSRRHAGTGEFLTVLPDGGLELARLIDSDAAP